MWKTLKHGEKVSLRDILRYRNDSNTQPLERDKFLVVRTDQHYFEVIREKEEDKRSEPPDRKVVRYTDIGYNVFLERWSES